MMSTNFNEMSTVKTEKELKRAVKFQGNMMPLGDWIIATRWAWDFYKEAMGNQAFLYRCHAEKLGPEAQISLAITSVDAHDGLGNQTEDGAWAMGMMLEAMLLKDNEIRRLILISFQTNNIL